MSTSSDLATPQEVTRRLRDYQQTASERRRSPHILYSPPFILCPWPNCEYCVRGVDFQLEWMGDQATYERLLNAWWNAGGLVGRCPGCGEYVLFTMQDKQRVKNPALHADKLLPDDWYVHAYLVS